MSDFGDADPEDAYDIEDFAPERYRILLLWLASVALEAAQFGHDHGRVLARIQSARWAAGILDANGLAGGLSARQRMRVKAVQDWLDDLLGTEGP